MHALSGCDTVPKRCVIRKVIALKIVTQNLLSFLCNLQSTTSDVVQETKQFVGRCYDVKNYTDMSEKR